MTTTTTATLTGVVTVAIPVTDQDRAIALYTGLGLVVTIDSEVAPGFRWVELAPPGGGAGVSVIRAGDHLPTGVDTGIRLATPDANATHAHLSGLGLNVGELLDWPTAPLMFEFEDHDGNTVYVTQQP